MTPSDPTAPSNPETQARAGDSPDQSSDRTPDHTSDHTSDPALDDGRAAGTGADNGADWSDEGGATEQGPATASPAETEADSEHE